MDYLLFNETDILERVDEYTLYCHYLGYEVIIGAKYPCPDQIRIRNGKPIDLNPSFGVFERLKGGNLPHEFLWKDAAVGHVGDIFALVICLFGYTTKSEAIQRIASEFGFGAPFHHSKYIVDPNEVREKKRLVPIDISIKSRVFNTRDLLYWDRYNADKNLLIHYDTTPFIAYWLSDSQKVPSYPKGMGFAYWILGKYQLYFPYASNKADKFRNDWNELCVPGFKQLQKDSDLCIITKAMKDVICLRSMGYEAIAPRGEHIMLPDQCIAYLKRHYKRIVVLFDNDGKHNGHKYEFDKVFVPKIYDTDKDTSDYCDNHGPTETKRMLNSILYGY